MSKKIIEAKLLVNKLIISKNYEILVEKGYGKQVDKRLELAFVEGLYLLEKNKIKVKKDGKKLDFTKLIEFGFKKDKRIHEKYTVYKDLREKGFLAKSGLKFGCDFRVYKRGVMVKKGPKAPTEHTQWIVFCVPEGYKCSFQELSRAVRLAHSIRAKMLWAVVDDEAGVTYYEVVRKKL